MFDPHPRGFAVDADCNVEILVQRLWSSRSRPHLVDCWVQPKTGVTCPRIESAHFHEPRSEPLSSEAAR